MRKVALCLILVLTLQLVACSDGKKTSDDLFESDYITNAEDEKYFTEGDSAETLLLSTPLYLASNKILAQPLGAFVNNRDIKTNEINALTDDIRVSLSEFRPKVENLRREVLQYLEFCREAYPMYAKSLEKITMDLALSAAKVEYSEQLLSIIDNSSSNLFVESYKKYHKIVISMEYAINIFNDLEKSCLSAATVQIALIDDPDAKLIAANRGLERAMAVVSELHLESQNIQKSLHNLDSQIKKITTANYYMGLSALAYIQNSQTEIDMYLKRLLDNDKNDKTIIDFAISNFALYKEAAATLYLTLEGDEAKDNENLVATYWNKSLAVFQQAEKEYPAENSLISQGYASLKEQLLLRNYLEKSKAISASTAAIKIEIPIVPKGEITGTVSLQKDLNMLARECYKANQRLNGSSKLYAEFAWKDGLLSIGTVEEKIALIGINLIGSYTFYQQAVKELAESKEGTPAAVIKLEISYLKTKKLLQNRLLIITALERMDSKEAALFAYGEKQLELLPEEMLYQRYQEILSKMLISEQKQEKMQKVKELLFENSKVQLEKLRKTLPISSGLAANNEVDLKILYNNWGKEILAAAITNAESANQTDNRVGSINLLLQDTLDVKIKQIILDSR